MKPLIWGCLYDVHTGLLIKQILVSAAETTSEHNLVDNTCGVVFYSVPHEGSSLAEYTSRSTAAYVLCPSVEVQDLRAGLVTILSMSLVHSWRDVSDPRAGLVTILSTSLVLGIYLLAGKTVKIDLTVTKGKYYCCYNSITSVCGKQRNETVTFHLVKTYCLPRLLRTNDS